MTKPRLLYASETVCYSSGRVAYHQGQPLYVVHNPKSGTWVYAAGPVEPTEYELRHGKGLLYTYGPEVPFEVDGRKI